MSSVTDFCLLTRWQQTLEPQATVLVQDSQLNQIS